MGVLLQSIVVKANVIPIQLKSQRFENALNKSEVKTDTIINFALQIISNWA